MIEFCNNNNNKNINNNNNVNNNTTATTSTGKQGEKEPTESVILAYVLQVYIPSRITFLHTDIESSSISSVSPFPTSAYPNT